jgi:hypothetical protein
MYDFNGRLVREANTTDGRMQIEVATLPAGMYILNLQTAQGEVSSHKVIVNK